MSASPTGRVEARIEGDVSGQIAVGSYIYQIRDVHGGVVNILPPEEGPELRPRTRPVRLQPRPFRGLLGREREVGLARSAAREGVPLEFHGVPGSGRTSLLRCLAYDLEEATAGDGIAYLSARGESLDGVLQELVDAFFESEGVVRRLTPTDIRHRLSDVRAVILVDDVELDRESVVDLTDSAPGSTFLLTTDERRVWGDMRSTALEGLSLEAAIELWEREAGPIDPDERPAVEALLRGLDGVPLRILQAAAMATEEGESARSLAARLEVEVGPAGKVNPSREAERRLDGRTRRVLAVLAAMRSPLTAGQVAVLADLAGAGEAASALDALLRLNLVTREGARFVVVDRFPELAAEPEGDESEKRRMVASVAAWVAGRGDAAAELTGDIPLLERALEWALELQAWPHADGIARSLDGLLALSGRWDAWKELLDRVHESAVSRGDRRLEAWALHQRGTRALCLGDTGAAAAPLTRAVEIRDGEGDAEGAARSRHNLEEAGLPVPAVRGGWKLDTPKIAGGGIAVAVATAVILSLTGADTVPTTSPAELDFASWGIGDTSGVETITVRNPGSDTLRLGGVDVETGGGDFAVARDDCSGATLPPSGECVFGVVFLPTAGGGRSGRLTISHGDTSVAVGLAGTGVDRPVGRLVADVDPVEFGGIQVGSTAARPVVIRNPGRQAVTVSGVDPPAITAFEVEEGDCLRARVEPGATCQLVVRFRPETVGPAEARLSIRREEGEPLELGVRGEGVAAPVGRLVAEPPVAAFGVRVVGETATAPVRLQNPGTAAVTISAIRVDGSPWFRIRDAGACEGARLEPGRECVLEVAFEPGEAGEAGARLSVTGGAAAPVVVSLTGSARPRPVGALEATPSPLRFGERPLGDPGGQPLRVEVRNVGDGAMRTGGISVEGADAGDFRVLEENCRNRALEPGAGCAIAVAFIAGGRGPRRAAIGIRTDVGDGIHRVPLEGAGVAPLRSILAVDPGALQFGEAPVPEGLLEQVVGALLGSTRTVQLVSRGTAPVTVGEIDVAGAHARDFGIRSAGCREREVLGPGESCPLEVTFQPREPGDRSARIVIEHGGDGGRSVVELSGVGVAAEREQEDERPPPGPTGPDLVVDLSVTGPVRAAGDQVRVPLRILVTNRGNAPAGPFKVAIETPNGGVATFDVSGPSPEWYARREESLGPGQRFVREGLTSMLAREGSVMRLTALVDSCAGEEFTPPHCHVQETDEDNNRSAPVSVEIPIF